MWEYNYTYYDDKAFAQEQRMKETYKKTGRNRVSRVINNARYDLKR